MELGTVYTVQPEPPDVHHTIWIDAGAVRFGVESRDVDPESLRQSYADDPDGWAEIEAMQPEGGFTDVGVSLHVVDAESEHELLRFDAFLDGPHYHYIHPDGTHNHVIPFDAVANGDPLEWALERLRSRLGPMLEQAGGTTVAAKVDAVRCATALDEVSALARSLQPEAPS